MNEHNETADELDPLDAELTALFADVRPSATLEERAVRALKADVRRRSAFAGWARTLGVGLAASVGLGLAGVGMSRVSVPGFDEATNGRMIREVAFMDDYMSDPEKRADLSNPDVGLDTHLKAAIESTREFELNVEEKVTPNSPVGSLSDRPIDVLKLAQEDLGESRRKSVDTRYGEATNYYLYTVPGGAPQPAEGRPLLTMTSPQPVVTGGTTVNGTVPANPGYSPGTGFTSDYVKSVRPTDPNAATDTKPTASPYVNLFGAAQPPAAGDAPAPGLRKIVIRSGDIEFEVESFDSAFAAVQQLVAGIKDAYIGTVNSDKMANGKVKGAIVVRVPPGSLDSLVLDLRKELGKAGELKGQRIGAQDITKQYTDLASRLRAARSMETRLLKIIAEGKGEIKQLLEAEKELGVWRTKIEEAEGELRYYDNLVSLSTLTINLTEREMRIATGLTESERVDAGVEVEDVETAYRELLKAVTDAKGRVMKAEIKQHNAGQFNAALDFEVAPEASGPVRDRLRQLGRVARLQIDQVQTADGGPVAKNAKVKKGDTVFVVKLYNLVNIPPRETATLQVASLDVPASYAALQDAVAKVKGRVLAATLNEQDRQNVTAQFDFEIRRTEEGALRAALAAAGETVSRTVARAVETDAVTDTKILYRTTLFNIAKLKARETTTLTVEVPDVENATSVLTAQVAEAKGKQVDSQTARHPSGQVTAKLTFAVPLAAAGGLVEKFKNAGTVRVSDTTRDPQAVDGPAATARIVLTLSSIDPIVARDDGLWPQVRKGLSYSATMLLKSVTIVIIGACVVLPWALVGYGGMRLFRRIVRRPQ